MPIFHSFWFDFFENVEEMYEYVEKRALKHSLLKLKNY